MSDFQIHRAGKDYVISTDSSGFATLVNIVRKNHLVHESPSTSPVEESGLRETIDAIDRRLPRRPPINGPGDGEVDGVTFVGHSTVVTVGVDRSVLQALADCLELAVKRGDSPQLHTLTGAWFPEIRSMYLAVSGALGHDRRAREIALGQASS